MNPRLNVPITFLPHGQGLPLPAYQSPGAAGLDLLAALGLHEHVIIEPGGRHLVPTGIMIELGEGFEAQVRPRSGLALHHGVTILNSPGTIDADYRGEIFALLINFGDAPFEIRRGARIAQLVIAPVQRVELKEIHTLSATQRGLEGFGSTGSHHDLWQK
jgi:dUTP pyrophosphatase